MENVSRWTDEWTQGGNEFDFSNVAPQCFFFCHGDIRVELKGIEGLSSGDSMQKEHPVVLGTASQLQEEVESYDVRMAKEGVEKIKDCGKDLLLIVPKSQHR